MKEMQKNMTAKERAWERRPGAWETTFSRESSKLQSRIPACSAREMPISTIFGCHTKLPGGTESVGKKIQEEVGVEQSDVKMEDSYMDPHPREDVPWSCPGPAAPRDQPTFRNCQEHWSRMNRLRLEE